MSSVPTDRRRIQFMNIHSLSPEEVVNVLRAFESRVPERNIICRRHANREDIIYAECSESQVNHVLGNLKQAMQTARQDPEFGRPSAVSADDKESNAGSIVLKHFVNPMPIDQFQVDLIKLRDLRDKNIANSVVVPRHSKSSLDQVAVLRCLKWDKWAGYEQLPPKSEESLPANIFQYVPDMFKHLIFADVGDASLGPVRAPQNPVQNWLQSSVPVPERLPEQAQVDPAVLNKYGQELRREMESAADAKEIPTGHSPNSKLVTKEQLDVEATKRFENMPPAPSRGVKTTSRASKGEGSAQRSAAQSVAAVSDAPGLSESSSSDDDNIQPASTQQEMVRALKHAVRKICCKAREFKGSVRLEVQLGRILLDASENVQARTHQAGADWAKILTQDEAVRKSPSIFTNRISTRSRDLGLIFTELLPTADARVYENGDFLAYHWSREWCIEFVCVDWQGRPLIVVVDGAGRNPSSATTSPSYHLRRPAVELSAVYVHHPKNVHDLKFVTVGSSAEHSTRRDTIRELLDHLYVRSEDPPDGAAPSYMPRWVCTKASRLELRVEGIRLRREVRYLMPGPAPVIAKFVELIDMAVGRKADGSIVGYMKDLADMRREGRIWQEFSLMPPVVAVNDGNDDLYDDGGEGGQQDWRLHGLMNGRMLEWLEFQARKVVQGTDLLNFPQLGVGWYSGDGRWKAPEKRLQYW